LQRVFGERRVVGVDNGAFGSLKSAFSEQAIFEARDGQPDKILDEKHARRAEMIEAISRVHDQRTFGSLDEFSNDTPVFLMFGRLDPGQKGFDLFSRAIESLPRGVARFIMTPIVGGAPEAFLDDLSALASSRAGEVVVYPFRWQSGYQELQAGASYVVMPSLYEPFGSATEAYLSGTPVVCRATGGLIQQVVDAEQEPAEGTGLLFRESVAGRRQAWTAIQSAATPQERMLTPTYRSMVAACAESLQRATEIYRNQPAVYGRMLANLYAQAAHFSWDRTIRQYDDVYRTATS
jgi:glycogen synthase